MIGSENDGKKEGMETEKRHEISENKLGIIQRGEKAFQNKIKYHTTRGERITKAFVAYKEGRKPNVLILTCFPFICCIQRGKKV
jgi:hypothetical protein